jgi:hypothetical protein
LRRSSEFRREYGAEMRAMFDERAAGRGLLGCLDLLLAAVPEMVGNALVLHLELLRQDLSYTMRTWRSAPGFALRSGATAITW